MYYPSVFQIPPSVVSWYLRYHTELIERPDWESVFNQNSWKLVFFWRLFDEESKMHWYQVETELIILNFLM